MEIQGNGAFQPIGGSSFLRQTGGISDVPTSTLQPFEPQGPIDSGPIFPRSGWGGEPNRGIGGDGGSSWKTINRGGDGGGITGAQPMYGVAFRPPTGGDPIGTYPQPIGGNPQPISDPISTGPQPMYGVAFRPPTTDPVSVPISTGPQPMYGVAFRPPTTDPISDPISTGPQPMYGVAFRPPSDPIGTDPSPIGVAQPMYGVAYRPPTLEQM